MVKDRKEYFRLRKRNLHYRMKCLIYMDYGFVINAKRKGLGRAKGFAKAHKDKEVLNLMFLLQKEYCRLMKQIENRNTEFNDRMSIITHTILYLLSFYKVFKDMKYPNEYMVDIDE